MRRPDFPYSNALGYSERLNLYLSDIAKSSGFPKEQIVEFIKTVPYSLSDLHTYLCENWAGHEIVELHKMFYTKEIQKFIDKQKQS